MGLSKRWKHWISTKLPNTCSDCIELHGKIYSTAAYELLNEKPPLHPNCHCHFEPLETTAPGTISRRGTEGPDWYLYFLHRLPEYYITKDAAMALGWKRGKGNLALVAPGKMIGGDIYKNRNEHLPMSDDRIWYECDVDYLYGFRNTKRILYSNDGLIFYTDDHYETFTEIILEGVLLNVQT